MHGWITEPVRLNGSSREGAIHALLARYKRLSNAESAAFMRCLRDQTGGGTGEVAGHWMTWDMIREMAVGGMTIGGHTRTHPVLSSLGLEAQREEIHGCAQRLQQELGSPMRYFAYPVGSPWAFNQDSRKCLEEIHVERAFSYYGGVATNRSDRYDTRRISIETHIDADLFRASVQLPQVFCRPDE